MSDQPPRFALPTGLGAFLALLVLIAVFVLWLMGQMAPRDALLLGLLAASRLC